MLKRFIAMLAVSALLLAGITTYYTRTGTRADGLYYAASGIRPDAQILSVNGETVSAEEYLYWLDSVCEYLDSYVGGGLDFNAQVTEDMTFSQFAKSDAVTTTLLYAVVRQMAQEQGITLTAEDQAALDAQRAQYVTYYGGEEAYALQLQILGVPEALQRQVEEVPFLYNRLFLAYSDPNGQLYPGAEALQTFGEQNDYVTAQLLYFPTGELDEAAAADMKTAAANYAAQLTAAADKQAAYAAMATALGLAVDAAGYTFCPTDSDPLVCAAVSNLAPGEVSDVIEGASGFYVALGMETNYASLAEVLFNIHLQELQDSAKVEYSKMYDALDAGIFYENLLEARIALMEQMLGQSR